MSIPKLLLSYFLTALVFIALDILWVGFVGRSFYRKNIGHLMSEDVNWIAIVIFYVVYLAGLFIFVVIPAHEKNDVVHAIVYGAVLGVVAYATYDLTNLGTLKNWPAIVAVVDIAWGGLVTAAAAVAGFYISKWI